MRKAILTLLSFQGLAFAQSILLLMPPHTGASAFLHSRAITIDHTKVGGSSLTSFPVLVPLALGAGKIQNASCFDIVFATDSAGTSRVPWEIDTCNQSTGAVMAWVSVSSLSSSVDTVFYAVYDNSGIGSPLNTGSLSPGTMWAAAGYLGVFHLGDGSTLQANDSTSNAFNGTLGASPTATAGQIGGAALLVAASSQYITIPTAMSPYGTVTVSLWLNISSDTDAAVTYLQGSNATTPDGIHVRFEPSTIGFPNGILAAVATTGTASGRKMAWPSITSWHHVVISKTTGQVNSIVVDGIDSSIMSVTSTFNGVSSNLIGSIYAGGASPLDGAVDEFRLRTGATTAGWATAEFNNQKSGSTFLTVGSEI